MTIKRKNTRDTSLIYRSHEPMYLWTNGNATVIREIVLNSTKGLTEFYSSSKSTAMVKTADLMSHNWTPVISQYRDKNQVDKITLDSRTFTIDMRIYNGQNRYVKNIAYNPVYRKMNIKDTVRQDLERLKQMSNFDISAQKPGKLVYKVYKYGSYYDDYVESYTTGYITGITINESDSNGWWVDVTLTFLSIDGYWIQEITQSGEAGSASSYVAIGQNLMIGSPCDYKITLHNVSRSTWDGYTIRVDKYNTIDYYGARCGTDDSEVTIDTLKGVAYSTSKTNYIPYLSPKKEPFKPLDCAGAMRLRITTPYAYDLTIYNKLTQPQLKVIGDE